MKYKPQFFVNPFCLRYTKIKADNEERSRLIVRGMYRLALAGIDVNARDTKGDTPLVKASATGDQNLITHLIRLGELLGFCGYTNVVICML